MAETGDACAGKIHVVQGEIDRKEKGAVNANALDQREEFGAVRNLTSKIATDRSVPDYYFTSVDSGGVVRGDSNPPPFQWENATPTGHKVSNSSDSQEFEFSLSGVVADQTDDAVPDGISPADELFFKGQLLPLNLPKRLQMVQKLSSPNRSDVSGKESTSAASAVVSISGARPVAVSCLFEPDSLKCSSLGDETCLGSALVNSRSSSFHSQGSHNFWESDSPGELDSGDCTSSRDSSGSSQDACSESEKRATVPKLFHDHSGSSSELLAMGKGRALLYSRHFLDGRSCRLPPSEKPQLSSWLRTSFKWKVFFGLKKPSRFSYAEGGTTVERGGQGGGKGDDLRTDSRESCIPPSSGCSLHTLAAQTNASNVTPSSLPAGHSIEEDQKAGRALGTEPYERELEFHAEFFSFPGADTGFGCRDGTAAAEIFGSGFAAPSKARDGVHKYFNILKPSLNGRATARPPNQTLETNPRAKSSFSGDLLVSCSKQPSTSVHSRGAALTKPAVQKTASCGQGQEQPRCRSPTSHSLSSNLRIPSFSRSSKTSTKAGKSSSNHSGQLSSSPSTMAELQSSIQGAIAHCKQSQSVGK